MELLETLGRRLREPHTLYLVGGSSAVVFAGIPQADPTAPSQTQTQTPHSADP